MIKPGYRTTEFWFTLVSFIFSGLYLVGLINDHGQKEELISNVSHAVESCILIAGQFAIFYKYIASRKLTKIEYEKTKRLEEENRQKNELNQPDGGSDEQQRPDNTRSRKTSRKNKTKSTKRKTSSSKRSLENTSGSNRKRDTNNRKAGNWFKESREKRTSNESII